MGRNRSTRELYVYMNNQLVGYLKQGIDGALIFLYAESWINWPYARPISLSMPLANKPYSGMVVYNFFDNLLPDSKLIRDRIQRRFSAKTNRGFDLLYYIGSDCVGALQITSNALGNDNFLEITGNIKNDNEIAQLLMHYKTAPLGMEEDSSFRISIAGAQEKTALLWHNNHWYLPSGTTPTTHILKLPIGYIEHSGIDLSDSVENEWLCMKILQAYGLPTANVSIYKFDSIKVLIVERFDRSWNNDNTKILRIPQEDMCQALGVSGNLKYESDGGPGIRDIMNLLQGSANSSQDRYNFMKTVFLYWVLGAIDGHAKNFSLTIGVGGEYNLSPLYDVISAYPLMRKKQIDANKIKMAMSVFGNNKHYKWKEIQLRHWFATAEACKFSKEKMQSIIKEIFDDMNNVLAKVQQNINGQVSNDLVKDIFSHMLQLRDTHRRHNKF